jgi:hypothetical protein
MDGSVGNLLIGCAILLSALIGFIIHTKLCKQKCPNLATESSDLENAVKEAKKAVPKAVWCGLGTEFIKSLTPRKQKMAEIVLETINEVENQPSSSNS